MEQLQSIPKKGDLLARWRENNRRNGEEQPSTYNSEVVAVAASEAFLQDVDTFLENTDEYSSRSELLRAGAGLIMQYRNGGGSDE